MLKEMRRTEKSSLIGTILNEFVVSSWKRFVIICGQFTFVVPSVKTIYYVVFDKFTEE